MNLGHDGIFFLRIWIVSSSRFVVVENVLSDYIDYYILGRMEYFSWEIISLKC
jgi:uncharacterized membrane protein YcgQ (UPF0703/DUF1980 family)